MLLLMMIQVQTLVGDLHKGHLGGHLRPPTCFFANNSRLKRATSTDMGVVSLCLSCQDASTDMQLDVRG